MVTRAAERRLEVVDATCPLVTKVHRQAIRYEAQGREVILVGHPGHPEVEGTRGRIQGEVHVVPDVEAVAALEVANPDALSYVTQTTLSVDDTRDVIAALLERFPTIQGPDLKDICYATTNRQAAVKDMLEGIDALVVVGSKNSSNSSRLAELGVRAGLPSVLVDHPDQLESGWVESVERIGVTAGASAPEELVQQILARLTELGAGDARELDGEPENVVFQMPAGLG